MPWSCQLFSNKIFFSKYACEQSGEQILNLTSLHIWILSVKKKKFYNIIFARKYIHTILNGQKN